MSGNARKPLEQSISTNYDHAVIQVISSLDSNRLALSDHDKAWEKRAGRKLPFPGKA